jgi:site-specific DNA-methyltransferase (adenine-specific)
MDYSKKSRAELLTLCKEAGMKGCSAKKKEELALLLSKHTTDTSTSASTSDSNPVQTSAPLAPLPALTLRQEILHGDTLNILPTLPDESVQIVLADPPYNIGKDFGNASDKQPMDTYLTWTDRWVAECLRVLKPNGTLFIFGFSEILALILARIPYSVNRRWLIWHYTNKNVASLHFWQRSHESILVLWKDEKVFHRDAVREPYTEGFLQGAAGKKRAATKGRFSKGEKDTTYNAHPAGALPRDVIKIPALAGGAGAKERVDHPTQKPLALCERLLKSCSQGPDAGLVLVPFAGSGSECVAAKQLGLPYVGIELNEDYVALCTERLQNLRVSPASTSVEEAL